MHNSGSARLAWISGFLVCTVARGGDAYLTSAPRLLTLAVAFFFLFRLVRLLKGAARLRPRGIAGLIAGAGAAAFLPLAPIDAPAGVVTSSVGAGYQGDLFEALERIDQNPEGMLGTRVTVTGEWTPATAGKAATVARRIMACCAADTVAVGFDVFGDRLYSGSVRSRVTVSGIVRARMWRGQVRYALTRARVRTLR